MTHGDDQQLNTAVRRGNTGILLMARQLGKKNP